MTDADAKLRAWWWHRQGLDGSPGGASPREILEEAVQRTEEFVRAPRITSLRKLAG